MSVITNHLSRERSVTIRPQTAPSLQQGKGKGFDRAASQERCPSVPPHLGLGLRQLVEELAGFLRPPTSHFPGKHHEPGATHLACELRIDPLFPAAGSRPSRTIILLVGEEHRLASRLTRLWCPRPTVPHQFRSPSFCLMSLTLSSMIWHHVCHSSRPVRATHSHHCPHGLMGARPCASERSQFLMQEFPGAAALSNTDDCDSECAVAVRASSNADAGGRPKRLWSDMFSESQCPQFRCPSTCGRTTLSPTPSCRARVGSRATH